MPSSTPRDQIVERDVARRRLQRHVRHARERHAAPDVGMQAAVRFLAPDERREIARRLPVDEHAVLDQVPLLPGHAFVVVADCRQAVRLRSVGDEIDDLRCRFAVCRVLSGVRKLVPA